MKTEKLTADRTRNVLEHGQALAQMLVTSLSRDLDAIHAQIPTEDRPMVLNVALALTLSALFGRRMQEFCDGATKFTEMTGPVELVCAKDLN